jgi:hypothetical protein
LNFVRDLRGHLRARQQNNCEQIHQSLVLALASASAIPPLRSTQRSPNLVTQ